MKLGSRILNQDGTLALTADGRVQFHTEDTLAAWREVMRPKWPADRPAVFMPHEGEFGHLVMDHVRFVHSHPAAHKIVCCPRDLRSLFPSAARFINHVNRVPDRDRVTHGAHRDSTSHASHARARRQLRERLAADHGPDSVVEPDAYPPPIDVCQIKPAPRVRDVLRPVDVCIAPRRRRWQPWRNYQHWPAVAARLIEQGLIVGIVGARDTSSSIRSHTEAWIHPDGTTAGSIDLLRRCRMFVGQDSGAGHLAAMLDTPMTIVGNRPEWRGVADDFTGIMQRTSAEYFHRAPDNTWTNPELLANLVVRGLAAPRPRIAVATLYTPEIAEWAAIGIDSWRRYCARHGYPLLIGDTSLDPTRHPSWSKLRFIAQHLDDYDWILWMDCDTIVADPARKLEYVLADVSHGRQPDLIFGQDRNRTEPWAINAGAFWVRSTPAARRTLQAAWDLPDVDGTSHFWEQAAFQHLIRNGPHDAFIQCGRQADRKRFNTFWIETQEGPETPFVIHYAGMDHAARTREMRKAAAHEV